MQYLEKIQKIDLEILAVEEEKKRCQAEIQSLSAQIESGKEDVAAVSAEIEGLRAQIREINERIEQSKSKVEKDEKRLNDIKNSKELNALTKEIAGAHKVKKQCEQETEAFNAQIDEKTKVLNEKQEAVDVKSAELERLTKELEDKTPAWQKAIEDSLASRETIKAWIRPDILKKYEMIRAKKNGQGIALVKDETCQGCFIHLPPQVSIILRRGTDELLSCPHCHRILYIQTADPAEAV